MKRNAKKTEDKSNRVRAIEKAVQFLKGKVILDAEVIYGSQDETSACGVILNIDEGNGKTRRYFMESDIYYVNNSSEGECFIVSVVE